MGRVAWYGRSYEESFAQAAAVYALRRCERWNRANAGRYERTAVAALAMLRREHPTILGPLAIVPRMRFAQTIARDGTDNYAQLEVYNASRWRCSRWRRRRWSPRRCRRRRDRARADPLAAAGGPALVTLRDGPRVPRAVRCARAPAPLDGRSSFGVHRAEQGRMPLLPAMTPSSADDFDLPSATRSALDGRAVLATRPGLRAAGPRRRLHRRRAAAPEPGAPGHRRRPAAAGEGRDGRRHRPRLAGSARLRPDRPLVHAARDARSRPARIATARRCSGAASRLPARTTLQRGTRRRLLIRNTRAGCGSRKMIHAVDLHACGEHGRVIVGGVADVPGASMFEKMTYLRDSKDWVRLMMLREPRGYPAANVNLLLPPTVPEADAGYVIMEQVEYPPMSGTNTICVVTTLLETGILEQREPVTELTLETPAGIVAREGHVPGRQGHRGRVPQRAGVRRAPRPARRGAAPRHRHGRRRLGRHVLRDRRRAASSGSTSCRATAARSCA